MSDWQPVEPGDEQHLVFKCPALRGVRDTVWHIQSLNGLSGDHAAILDHFMWQHEKCAIAQSIRECMDAQVILALRIRHQISPRWPEMM